MSLLRWLLTASFRPWRAFPGPFPGELDRWGAVAILRIPLGCLALVQGLRGAGKFRAQLVALQGPWGEALLRARGGLEVEELREALQALPQVPSPGAWMLGVVPLLLGATWLHHAAWDHLGLWLTGGLAEGRGWRATARAEAEALAAGAPGVLLACAGLAVGLAWMLPLLIVAGGWYWALRGFALAAHHGCAPWRGVAATLVHGGLMLLLGGAIMCASVWVAVQGMP